VYANTLRADFTFDDQFAILSNGDVLAGARYTQSLSRLLVVRTNLPPAATAVVDGGGSHHRDTDDGHRRGATSSASSSPAASSSSPSSSATSSGGEDGGPVHYGQTVSGGGEPALLGLLAGPLWVNDFWGQNLTSEGSHKSWRPLTVLSFRLNAAVGKVVLTPGCHEVGYTDHAGCHQFN
jgi:hypothetical protein